jgi:hypothetical protein
MLEEMVMMLHSRRDDVEERMGHKAEKVLQEARKAEREALRCLFPPEGLEGGLAGLRSLLTSPLSRQGQELIGELGLEEVWKEENKARQERWKEEQEQEQEQERKWEQKVENRTLLVGERERWEREQERARWERERERWEQELVLGSVQALLQQEQSRLQRSRQETLGPLLHLVEVRQTQLMEPWRLRKELHEEVKVLQDEMSELGRVLPQIRMASAHLLPLPQDRLAGRNLDQLWPRVQGTLKREVDWLVIWPGTRYWSALPKDKVEASRARLRPIAIQGQEPLLDVILANHSKFISQSPYLDALLVFVSVISSITNSRKN